MTKKIFFLGAMFVVVCGSLYFFKIKKDRDHMQSYGYGFMRDNYLSHARGDVQDFALLDHLGIFHTLFRDSDAKAVVFISQANDCKIIENLSPYITELKNKYGEQNIVFYLLNSNPKDTRTDIIEEAQKFSFAIPVLMDPSQVVAQHLGFSKTAQAVVISPEDWKIQFRGDFDENFAKVLDSVLKNETIPDGSELPSKGRLIDFAPIKSLSYEKVIAPILANKCLSCHSESVGLLPYLDSYDKVKGWASMAKETILTDRMPPWSSDPLYGSYMNDISLTPEEKRVLVKWLNAGAPNVDKVDPLVSANEKLNFRRQTLKRLKPIYSVKYTEKNIPPGGLIEYRYAQIAGPIPYDMWITGHQSSSTSPRQTHHEVIMVTSKPISFYEDIAKRHYDINDSERKNNVDGVVPLYLLHAINKYEIANNPDNYMRFLLTGGGMKQPKFHRPGLVIYIPKGSYFILEGHYMGTGKYEDATTTFDFYGHREKPVRAKHIRRHFVTAPNLVIPAGAKNYTVSTNTWVPNKNIHIINFNGHLHMRGTSIRTELKGPIDKNPKTIISVPNYFYGWGTGSYLVNKEAIAVKSGSELKATCHFDNSTQNPYNPDPTKIIRFGQRVDRSEMCIMHIMYTVDEE